MRQRCRWALCIDTCLDNERYCDKHLPRAREKYEQYTSLYERERRETDAQYRQFYNSKDWKDFRAAVLGEQPICTCCKRAFANEVHHIVPLKADWSRRLDKTNVLPWCKPCHSRHELEQRRKGH